MRKLLLSILLTGIFCVCISNIDPEILIEKYKLNPKEKTSYQWIKLFKDKNWLKQHKLYSLSQEELNELLDYLITNAADADVATIPGL